jgi:2-hydroxychromene-2-carboxylate isomerase
VSPPPVGAPIQFLFDFVSPYAYLAWTQVHALAARQGCSVVAVPVLFAALLDSNGQKGPGEIPLKRAYLYKDCVRLAHVFGVPFAPPPAHPFNPLLALRVASLPLPEPVRRALIDRLFRAAWGGGGGITDASLVADAATATGLDGAQSVLDAGRPEVKERLRHQTSEALAAGAFGVPTMLAGDELFWGVDSLPHLERYLEGNDPVDSATAERWANVPVAATRRAAG